MQDGLGQKVVRSQVVKMHASQTQVMSSQQHTNVVEANFQGLVAAKKNVSDQAMIQIRQSIDCGKLPHQNSNFFGDFMLKGGP
jgi:hypothetical protein